MSVKIKGILPFVSLPFHSLISKNLIKFFLRIKSAPCYYILFYSVAKTYPHFIDRIVVAIYFQFRATLSKGLALMVGNQGEQLICRVLV